MPTLRLSLPLVCAVLFTFHTTLHTARLSLAQTPKCELLSVHKIWDQAPHNAFTDLVRWKDKFYCAFREGEHHAGDKGNLRVIASSDGSQWESVAILTHEVYDLRDAALSVTADRRLMVLGGVQIVEDGKPQSGTFVSFTEDGAHFSEPRVVIPPGRWLWRVTDHPDGTLYGVDYRAERGDNASRLLKTSDGIHYETVVERFLTEGDWPTEARVRFGADGKAYCLHRVDGSKDAAGRLGIADAPFTTWQWFDLGMRIGGPNFLQLPTGDWIAAVRLYDGGARTELLYLDMEKKNATPILRLPSGGDTSYAGMVWHENLLWVSYYSSHEQKTNIYLAKVRFPELTSAEQTQATPTFKLGARRELMVDRYLIDQVKDAELRLHAPQAAEKVLTFDHPWEGAFCGYATVLKDGDSYKMYYRGLPRAGRDGTDAEVTCYAESRDGIHWEKPELGIHTVDGSTANNIVIHGQTPASHNFSPFLDTNRNAKPNERFKALGGTSAGLIAFTSPDGTHWHRVQQEPVFTAGVFDSQNVAFWSEAEQKYLCYFRTWTDGGYRGFRSVSRTTSEDFIHWSKPEAMTFGDTPYEHLYTNQTSPYFRAPHLYVGIAARFMPDRRVLTKTEEEAIQVDPNYANDISDAVLLTSRGGNRYDRTFMESFVRPGLGVENWVSRTNYPALGIVPIGETEMSFYVQKNYGQPTSHLQRYRIRLDGFASLHAGYSIGEVLTHPLDFRIDSAAGSARQLTLNMSTSAAGSIRVELQNEMGEVVPGYSLQECDEIIGDRIEHTVTWSGRSDIADAIHAPVRLRFQLRDADIYSLQVR